MRPNTQITVMPQMSLPDQRQPPSPRQVFAPPCEATAALFLSRSKMKVKEKFQLKQNWVCVFALLCFLKMYLLIIPVYDF